MGGKLLLNASPNATFSACGAGATSCDKPQSASAPAQAGFLNQPSAPAHRKSGRILSEGGTLRVGGGWLSQPLRAAGRLYNLHPHPRRNDASNRAATFPTHPHLGSDEPVDR